MRYQDYIEGAPYPCVTEEQFVDVCGRIRAENRMHLTNLMMALKDRRRIDAIRELRSLANFDLKEAKDYVEVLMDSEPNTLGDILNHAVAMNKSNYLVIREGEHTSYVRGTLVQCRENADDVVHNYPHERVYVCQILSESQEVTTSKMVNL